MQKINVFFGIAAFAEKFARAFLLSFNLYGEFCEKT